MDEFIYSETIKRIGYFGTEVMMIFEAIQEVVLMDLDNGEHSKLEMNAIIKIVAAIACKFDVKNFVLDYYSEDVHQKYKLKVIRETAKELINLIKPDSRYI